MKRDNREKRWQKREARKAEDRKETLQRDERELNESRKIATSSLPIFNPEHTVGIYLVGGFNHA